MGAAEATGSLIGFALEDRYRILREIGRGGMGVVYEAEHVQLGKRIAVKMMLEKYAQDAEAVARFQREALAASRIGNPHIIDVSHIGTAPDGRPFVVMELLSGAPLSRIIEQTGPMPPSRAMDIMRQTLRAVGAAHAKGIVHRDLKPDNIFLVDQDDRHDFVKLLDFGISKVMDTADQVAITRLTTTGMVMGTPLYMAPEQAMGSVVDHQADLYALGVILYEMLAGRPPFDGSSYPVLVAKLLTATPPNLGEVRKGLPGKLVTAVHRALEKEPTSRFASAEAFAAALPLERTASHSALEIAGTIGPDSGVTPAVPTVRTKRPGLWFGVGIGVVVLAGIVVVVAVTRGAEQDSGTATGAGAGTASATGTGSGTGSESIAAGSGAGAGSIAAGSGSAESGKLEVKTIPAGGSVRVDGKDAGSAPIEIVLAPGPHQVHIELAGYQSVDEDEVIHATERTSAVITLQPTRAGTVPKHDRPKHDVPRHDVPKTDLAKHDLPKADVPKTDVPKTDVPKADVPKTDLPKTDVPKTDVPKHDLPKADGPKTPANGNKPNPY